MFTPFSNKFLNVPLFVVALGFTSVSVAEEEYIFPPSDLENKLQSKINEASKSGSGTLFESIPPAERKKIPPPPPKRPPYQQMRPTQRPSSWGFGPGMFSGDKWTSPKKWMDWDKRRLWSRGRGPEKWFQFDDPKEGAAEMWEDFLDAPYEMGEMPPGWYAPQIGVPNPIDLGDQMKAASEEASKIDPTDYFSVQQPNFNAQRPQWNSNPPQFDMPNPRNMPPPGSFPGMR